MDYRFEITLLTPTENTRGYFIFSYYQEFQLGVEFSGATENELITSYEIACFYFALKIVLFDVIKLNKNFYLMEYFIVTSFDGVR